MKIGELRKELRNSALRMFLLAETAMIEVDGEILIPGVNVEQVKSGIKIIKDAIDLFNVGEDK